MTRLAVGAVALLLALAGCGGDPKADPSPAPSTPATSPVSTTPTPPALPDAAKANTKAGAVAFARYYVELINHAQATGDVEELSHVEDAACQSCRDARKGVVAHYQAGGSIKGGEWQIESASAVKNAAISGWVVDLNVSYGTQTVSFGSDRPDKINAAGRMIVSVQVERGSGRWQVLEWTRA